MTHPAITSSRPSPFRRRTRVAVALVTVAALALTACGDSDDVGTGDTTAPTTLPSTSVPVTGSAALLGRSFIGTDITVDGEPKVLIGDSTLRLAFDEDGTVGAQAGCNSMGGTPDAAALDDGRLIITGGVMMTEMACNPEALMDQDTWFAELLGNGLDWTLEDDDLVLVSGGTVIRLTDRAVAEPDMDLAGTVWTVDGIIDGDAVSSVPADVAATVVLKSDGTAEVHTGCNSGSGSWSRTGDQLTLGSVALTKMACLGEAGELEEAVTPTLESGTLTIEIDGSHLTLLAEDGNGLTFVGGQLVPAPGEAGAPSTTSS